MEEAAMALLSSTERTFLQAVSKVATCNPYLPERIEYRQEALGSDFREEDPVFRMPLDKQHAPHINFLKIQERCEALVSRLRERLIEGATATEQELRLYEDATLWLLYFRYEPHFLKVVVQSLDGKLGQGGFGFYDDFLRDFRRGLHIPGVRLPTEHNAPHLFAFFFQFPRAFHHIFSYIIGGSMAAARLRAAVWQSIFTHDLRRYRDTLYERMGDVTTLVTGPSGTGKELVAQAIGRSCYIPFDPKKRAFSEDFTQSFHALNLSALTPTLIESELFGHRRGAFTGALQDKQGWLEICQRGGAVFLDEIGDLDTSIQVKLLRVLQTRRFQSVGDTKERHFQGKIIAATNRDLAEAMHQGHLREDFYYRLCSDMIVTPSLHEQLHESPAELKELLLFIAQRVAGSGAEALAQEVEAWILKHLGSNYEWPGNIRELEQCVRSVLIRKEYRPAKGRALPAREEFLRAVDSGRLTADELLRGYCTLVYSQTRSYQETARRLGLDRRTVKKKIDEPD
jgi:transcriptional regulator with AAA-type ATPase domain